MRLTWLLALQLAAGALSGCAGKLTRGEVDDLRAAEARSSTRSLEEARADVLARHGLIALPSQPQLVDQQAPDQGGRFREIARAPAYGLVGGETIVEIRHAATPPQIGFRVPSCADGNSCSCLEPAVYLLARKPDEGRLVVVRLVARDHTRSVRQSGTCGVGCGVPSPRQPDRVYTLSGRGPGDVRIVEGTFDRTRVAATCDHVTHAP